MTRYNFQSMAELLQIAADEGLTLAGVVIRYQEDLEGKSREEVRRAMGERLAVMRAAARKGLHEDIRSPSGLVGGGGKLLEERRLAGQSLCAATTARAIALAMAVAEVNASMGRVVAAPTAGSCGILPGVLLALEAEKGLDEDLLIDGLFAAAGIGMVAAGQASLSGAALGCQAEVGVAAAMAAAAAVEMTGGDAVQAANAAGVALQGLMGLVCDPVGGLVEVPCVMRNAMGAAQALVAADIALAGVQCYIPFDEIVAAMVQVGRALPPELRETGAGGIAACPTARKLARQIGIKTLDKDSLQENLSVASPGIP
ncbi:L-serine dehydratase, iron-sulfur-dependent subunit alpha [Moorella thermoacetica]|uniref:L-serine dehydratase n=3 Tax=Neomoorella thermoacetica TaxID=1525 RepID=A0AAC9HJ42_NEOTH|nr:L-serine ammonia-lyase, iron-sulfur-dependent, subunit alpha [Moorella thermoacetica]AKX94768.1 L-serine dehydratase, alpha chain [Moorella thermoacetica]AKX97400.1 L-serine dehydratase, alpha chain [Moorella thermoacetica]AOQ24904.1 L-serine dehydratase, alpha chain [Moorella thermoacetica]OIQ57181.1 L-serine dehydratase, alpha chain [Moorella thermoacetica]QDA01227.1 L-serine dehydratase, alpha chain [Moorella thermoacetica]